MDKINTEVSSFLNNDDDDGGRPVLKCKSVPKKDFKRVNTYSPSTNKRPLPKIHKEKKVSESIFLDSNSDSGVSDIVDDDDEIEDEDEDDDIPESKSKVTQENKLKQENINIKKRSLPKSDEEEKVKVRKIRNELMRNEFLLVLLFPIITPHLRK